MRGSGYYNQREPLGEVEEEGGEESGEEGDRLDDLSAKAYQLFTLEVVGRPWFAGAEAHVQLVLKYSRARADAFSDGSAAVHNRYDELRSEVHTACVRAYSKACGLIGTAVYNDEKEVASEAFDLAGWLMARLKPRSGAV
jgi:hypothetical protein